MQPIQPEVRKNGRVTLTHQKWNGFEFVNAMGNFVSGGLSTWIMSAGVTETQLFFAVSLWLRSTPLRAAEACCAN